MHFNKLLNENQVEQILNTCIIEEATEDDIEVFSKLEDECLSFFFKEKKDQQWSSVTLEGIIRSEIYKKSQTKQEETKKLVSFDFGRIQSSNSGTIG